METVFRLSSSFPTVIYTVPLLICLIFWLVSMLGVFDMDVFETDIDASSGFAGLLATCGLAGVPMTLSLSILFLLAWSCSLFASAWLLPLITVAIFELGVGIAVLMLSFLLAIYITARITKPLSKLFIVHEARSNQSLVSQTCIVSSLHVDQHFGQAKVEDGGAGLVISVRAEQTDNLSKNDRALIYQYDAINNLYYITKLDT